MRSKAVEPWNASGRSTGVRHAAAVPPMALLAVEIPWELKRKVSKPAKEPDLFRNHQRLQESRCSAGNTGDSKPAVARPWPVPHLEAIRQPDSDMDGL